MKCVRGLPGVVLVSLLSVQPGVAMSKVAEQTPNSTLSTQTKPVVMSNLFRDIQRAVQTVEQVNQIRLQEERRQEAKRRRKELEAARKAATEQQRLEAERRRQYFESLSPEEKEVYLAEQRVRREQKAEKEAALLLLMLGVVSGGSGSTQQDDDDRVCSNERQVGVNDFERMTAGEARQYGLVCY